MTRNEAYEPINVYAVSAAPHPIHSPVSTGRRPHRSDARPAGTPAASPNTPATESPTPTEVALRPTNRVKYRTLTGKKSPRPNALRSVSNDSRRSTGTVGSIPAKRVVGPVGRGGEVVMATGSGVPGAATFL